MTTINAMTLSRLMLLASTTTVAAESFDGRWEGVLIPNERCKDGTIEFEVRGNRIANGSLQGTIPDGRLSKGSLSSVEPAGSDGRMKILIGGKFPGELTFTGKTFHASFATPNCAQRQAKGQLKE